MLIDRSVQPQGTIAFVSSRVLLFDRGQQGLECVKVCVCVRRVVEVCVLYYTVELDDASDNASAGGTHHKQERDC
jgi:hypothetical protein